MKRKRKGQSTDKKGFFQKAKTNIDHSMFMLRMIRRASPGRIGVEFLLVIMGTVSSLLFNVFLLRYIVNGYEAGLPFDRIAAVIVGVVLFMLLNQTISSWFSQFYMPRANQEVYRNLQKRLFDKMKEVEIACFETPQFYTDYVAAASQVGHRTWHVLSNVTGIFSTLLTVLTTSYVIFTIDPVLIVFALLPFFYGLLTSGKKNDHQVVMNLVMQEKGRRRDYVKNTFFLAEYAKEMRLTNIQTVLFRKFSEAVREMKDVAMKYGKLMTVFCVTGTLISQVVVYLGGVAYASYQTLVTGSMLVGNCLVVINSIGSVSGALSNIANLWISADVNAKFIAGLRNFFDYKPTIDPNPDGLLPPEEIESVKLEHVTFQYVGGDRPSLRDVSIRIGGREKIALVGHNGAGKSTLVKLLMRLYDPKEGQLLLNDLPAAEYKLEAYRELYGTIFQDFQIYALSIVENILLKPDITEDDRALVWEALRKSGLEEKVRALPNTIDTPLTREFDEDGAIFSGGEYQKIALARVFARQSRIVILDEPSSALDPIAEYNMYESMMEACRDRAMVFISHRLSSAVLADRIYFMENGEVIAEGTHAELLQTCPKYNEMWHMQADQYNKKGASVSEIGKEDEDQ